MTRLCGSMSRVSPAINSSAAMLAASPRLAASMAALLFIAGDTRDMLPHSRVMIHDPLIGGAGVGGSALSVKARADDLMRIRDITAQVIAEHTGMPLERVFELTARDTYFEAEEAVAAHLADRVIREL